MIGKSGLFSILQFVALIIPAFVVLMELVLSRDINERIEVGSFEVDEFRLLQYSLFLVMIGGGLILYRLLSFMESPVTALGVISIFGSIPISLLAIWILSNRRAPRFIGQESFSDQVRNNARGMLFQVVSLCPVLIGPGAVYLLTRGWVNEYLAIGQFYNGWVLTPHQFLSIGLAICTLKGMISVNEQYKFSDIDISRLVGGSAGVGIVLTIIYGVYIVIPLILAWGILNFGSEFISLSPSNLIFNLPFAWAAIVFYALIAFDYDPNISTG